MQARTGRELRPALSKDPFVEAVLTSTAAAVDNQLEDGKRGTLSPSHKTQHVFSAFLNASLFLQSPMKHKDPSPFEVT